MNPNYTIDVAECFPDLLSVLVSMGISTNDVQSSTLVNNDIIHRLNCVVLGKLIEINRDLLPYALLHQNISIIKFIQYINLIYNVHYLILLLFQICFKLF